MKARDGSRARWRNLAEDDSGPNMQNVSTRKAGTRRTVGHQRNGARIESKIPFHPLRSPPSTRHALGSNRQAMIDTLFGGHTPVLSSWVLPNQPEAARPEQLMHYDYNPDLARKQLDEAGYADPDGDGIRASPDGLTLTFQLLTTEGAPIRQQIASMFQKDMRAIGVDIQLLPVPSDQLFSADGPLFQRQFDLALFGWIAGADPGGLQLWGCDAVPSPENNWTGDNFAGWCFRDANRAIREAVTTVDIEKRQDAYLRQQKLWSQELPSLPLFQRLSLALIAPKVRGPQPDALSPITWNIATWKREK